MTAKLPVLDPKPTGSPHDWNYNKIQMVKVPPVEIPDEWKNPDIKHLARRDQDARGTCVGMSSAYLWDLNYVKLTGDAPTSEDRAQYQKDVVDPNGVTIHDILFPTSTSAECFYQKSREIGNVTYPAGSEIRFVVRAMKEFGACLEKDWPTDKSAHGVYLQPPNPDIVKAFAENHRASGYAVVYGWDAIKQAIYEKGFVLGAIPIYANYIQMQGGDGAFPDPRGEISGYHALCFYGYDADHLYLLHSWGDWCGMFGSISKKYYDVSTMDEQHFLVVLDDAEVRIAREQYASLDITSNVPAQISVDGVVVGNSPQKIAIEHGRTYLIAASAGGYIAQQKSVDDSVTSVSFMLEPIAEVKKSWFQILIEWILGLLFKR